MAGAATDGGADDRRYEGELEVIVADDFDGRSTILPRLHTAAGVLDVRFGWDVPHGLWAGRRVNLTGARVGDQLLATGGGVVDASELGGACATTGPQRAIVIRVQTAADLVPNASAAELERRFFSTEAGAGSLAAYWKDASYDQISLTGDVVGPYTVASCDINAMRTAALAAADDAVDFRAYDRIFLVSTGCSFAGYGTLGCGGASTAGDGGFVASTAWLSDAYLATTDGASDGPFVMAHEGGHGLALGHAASRDYPVGDGLGPIGGAASIDEYGDRFSAMGSWNPGHYAAPHKAQLGWLAEGTTMRTLEPGPGAVAYEETLRPMAEQASGLKALKVRRRAGEDEFLWLEYRQPIGDHDARLGVDAFAGALVHYQDATTGDHSHLLDLTPASGGFADPTLAAGATWTDPYGPLELTIGSPTAGGLPVTVTYRDAITPP